MKRSSLIVILIVIACIVLYLIATAGPDDASPTPAATKTYLHLDGVDAEAGITIQTINLWNDYDNRGAGIAGTGRHGEQVTLVRRSGNGVLVELANGTRGWVSSTFIREYK